MLTSNPTLGAFGKVEAMTLDREKSDAMTVEGTIGKAGILGLILLLAFAFAWITKSEGLKALAIFGGSFGGLITGLIISFKPKTVPYLSPIYAALEGLFLGAFSAKMEAGVPGITAQAAGLTIATLFAMLLAYRTGLIVVNKQFRALIVGAMLAIVVYYAIGLLCLPFHIIIPGTGLQSSLGSIIMSGIIVIVAALSLVLDFDFIAKNAGTAPKYMEWYGAFSLLVTVIWLYIEILRLLIKLGKRN